MMSRTNTSNKHVTIDTRSSKDDHHASHGTGKRSTSSRSSRRTQAAAAAQDNIEVTVAPKGRDDLPVQRLHVDQVFFKHPRSLYVLALIELCSSVQVIIFTMICHFYDGCPYFSGIWCGIIMATTSVLGIVLVKFYPKSSLLYIYLIALIITDLVVLILFAVMSSLLKKEESIQAHMRRSNRLFQGHGIVRDTRIAMYSLGLILTAIYGLLLKAYVLFHQPFFVYLTYIQTRKDQSYLKDTTSQKHLLVIK